MADVTDITTMLVNLDSSTYLPLLKLFTAASYLIGIGLTIKAIYALKVYGDLRTMASEKTDLRGPLTQFLAASVFLFMPTAWGVINASLFGTGNILQYQAVQANDNYDNIMKAVVHIIQLIGLVGFMRGWMIISHLSAPSAQQASMGKGIAHIIGGALAINIVQTWDVIKATLGLS